MTERNSPPGTAEDLARSLLASARLDVEPAPDAVRYGIFAALGTAGALGGTSALAGVAWGALRRLGLLKWLATTALLGTVGVGAYVVMNRTPSSTANAGRAHEGAQAVAHDEQAPTLVPPTTDASESPGAPAREAPESGAITSAPSAQRPRAAASKVASSDQSSEVSSLEEEVAALDAARTVLAGGDPLRTLKLLDQYQQAFPKGALRPEASYLRIQALSKAGQAGAAREQAARFLASHPKSPHAAQLQALLSR